MNKLIFGFFLLGLVIFMSSSKTFGQEADFETYHYASSDLAEEGFDFSEKEYAPSNQVNGCQGCNEVSMIFKGIRSYKKVKKSLDVAKKKTLHKVAKLTGFDAKSVLQMTHLALQLSQGRISSDLIKIRTRISNIQISPRYEYRFEGSYSGALMLSYSF